MTPFETTLSILLTALGAYLAGSFPSGFLIGKAKGLDIRRLGSGNIGATNVTRVAGKTWGRVCFCLDFLKGFLPVIAVSCLTRTGGILSDDAGILPAAAAFCAVCGHIWPVWLGFRGGKGVSTAAGAILALSPLPLLSAVLVWAIVFFTSRYVSLASVNAAALLPCFALLYNHFQIGRKASVPELILLFLLALLTILKHSSNIRRLCQGTENRFEKKSAPPARKEKK